MGLPRLVILAAAIAGGVWLWRRLNQRPAVKQQPSAKMMVRCAHCHVHLPEDRALSKKPHWYCSAAHLEHGPSQRD